MCMCAYLILFDANTFLQILRATKRHLGFFLLFYWNYASYWRSGLFSIVLIRMYMNLWYTFFMCIYFLFNNVEKERNLKK